MKRQLTAVEGQKDRLLNLRLLDEIDADTYAAKHRDLRDREAALQLQLEATGRQQSELAELALKTFELSQALEGKWLTADIPEKRQILEIICLNLTLDDVTLVPTMRKPFDVLAEGLLMQNGDPDGI